MRTIGKVMCVAALTALGLAPRLEGDVVQVSVPSWRVDLEREADLVEEIARASASARVSHPCRTHSGNRLR